MSRNMLNISSHHKLLVVFFLLGLFSLPTAHSNIKGVSQFKFQEVVSKEFRKKLNLYVKTYNKNRKDPYFILNMTDPHFRNEENSFMKNYIKASGMKSFPALKLRNGNLEFSIKRKAWKIKLTDPQNGKISINGKKFTFNTADSLDRSMKKMEKFFRKNFAYTPKSFIISKAYAQSDLPDIEKIGAITTNMIAHTAIGKPRAKRIGPIRYEDMKHLFAWEESLKGTEVDMNKKAETCGKDKDRFIQELNASEAATQAITNAPIFTGHKLVSSSETLASIFSRFGRLSSDQVEEKLLAEIKCDEDTTHSRVQRICNVFRNIKSCEQDIVMAYRQSGLRIDSSSRIHYKKTVTEDGKVGYTKYVEARKAAATSVK